MTSEHNPYARPPRDVFVFAHVADAHGADFVPAGSLEGANTTQPVFVYGKRYVQRPYAVEVDPVALPLKDDEGGAKRFVLAGLTEFGGIRDAAPDSWGRRVIENKLKVAANKLPEVAYLLEAGSDRVGALDVRLTRDSKAAAPVSAETDLVRLLEAADRIENEEHVGEDLAMYFGNLSSAGGARPKASVRTDDGVLWLAKFPSNSDRACNAVLEAGALELARAAGLRVPPVKVKQVGHAKVLFIRRFDRYWAEPGVVPDPDRESWVPLDGPGNLQAVEGRIGFCSALTLMGLDEHDATRSSYKALAEEMRARALPQYLARDLRELFKRQALNIFVTNNDDHLRNHGFLYQVAAKGWTLSPLYDVLPMSVVAQERMLHLEVGERGRLATLDNLMTHWAVYFSSKAEALKALHEVWLVARAWKPFFEKFDASQKDMAHLEGAIRRLDQIAAPELEKELRDFQGSSS